MLDFMPDVGCCEVVVKALSVIFYFYFLFCSIFAFSFDKLFFELVESEGLNEGIELFLLVVPSRSSRIDENLGTYDCSQDFRLLGFVFLNVNHDQQVEILPFVIVGGRRELHCTEIHLPVDHLHFTLASNAYILQN